MKEVIYEGKIVYQRWVEGEATGLDDIIHCICLVFCFLLYTVYHHIDIDIMLTFLMHSSTIQNLFTLHLESTTKNSCPRSFNSRPVQVDGDDQK